MMSNSARAEFLNKKLMVMFLVEGLMPVAV